MCTERRPLPSGPGSVGPVAAERGARGRSRWAEAAKTGSSVTLQPELVWNQNERMI